MVRTTDAALSFKDLSGEEETRIKALEALLLVLEDIAPECTAQYARDILEPLSRLLYELSKEGADANKELLEVCVKCICKVKTECPKEFSCLFDGIEKEDVNPVFDASMRRILSSK